MANESKQIQVVAIGAKMGKQTGEVVGYYAHKRRKAGEKFTIYEHEFSARWMERLTAKESREVEEEEHDTRPRRKRADRQDSVI